MPVSKRTRYEVLKRDNHTCRYCGGVAPAVILTIDHVTPVALGGSDNPDNLVAACRDCNYGKASTSPEAALVDDVSALDLKWARAIARVTAARGRQRKKRDAYVSRFDAAWGKWHRGPNKEPISRPAGWETSIGRFYDLGVPIEELEHLVVVACGNDRVYADQTFRYFAGCVWRLVTDLQNEAKQLLEAEATDGA